MTKSYIKKTEYATYYFKDEARTILHRVDGPAVEYADGTKYWYMNGKNYSKEEHKRLAKMINFL